MRYNFYFTVMFLTAITAVSVVYLVTNTEPNNINIALAIFLLYAFCTLVMSVLLTVFSAVFLLAKSVFFKVVFFNSKHKKDNTSEKAKYDIYNFSIKALVRYSFLDKNYRNNFYKSALYSILVVMFIIAQKFFDVIGLVVNIVKGVL